MLLSSANNIRQNLQLHGILKLTHTKAILIIFERPILISTQQFCYQIASEFHEYSNFYAKTQDRYVAYIPTYQEAYTRFPSLYQGMLTVDGRFLVSGISPGDYMQSSHRDWRIMSFFSTATYMVLLATEQQQH